MELLYLFRELDKPGDVFRQGPSHPGVPGRRRGGTKPLDLVDAEAEAGEGGHRALVPGKDVRLVDEDSIAHQLP